MPFSMKLDTSLSSTRPSSDLSNKFACSSAPTSKLRRFFPVGETTRFGEPRASPRRVPAGSAADADTAHAPWPPASSCAGRAESSSHPIGVRIVCIVLETHRRVTKAASDLVGSPFVNQKELEIRRAERLFHRDADAIDGVAEGHRFLGPLPFYVAKPCCAQHDVWVGRHKRCERAK